MFSIGTTKNLNLELSDWVRFFGPANSTGPQNDDITRAAVRHKRDTV